MKPHRAIRPRAVVVAAAAALVAIGVAASPHSDDRDETTAVPSALAVADVGSFPSLLVDEEVAHQAVADLTRRADGRQAEALGDGAVDAAEYRAAVESAQRCLVSGIEAAAAEVGIAAEVVTSPAVFSPDGFLLEYGYSVDVEPGAEIPPDALDRVDDIGGSCVQGESLAVEQAFQLGLRSDPGYVEEVLGSLEGCLAGEGLEVDLTPADALDTVVDLPEEAGDCLHDHPSVLFDARPEAMAGSWGR
jgi:hypothetical protein